ncbi:hypothetical protein ACQ4PT_008567 [Festuca glaucescens]
MMLSACLQEEKRLRPYDERDPTAYGGPALLSRPAGSAAPPSAPPEMSLSSSTGSERSATEARALKIHSEAERRRRERINAHLAALRRMIPDTKQMDKATLLARVVDQVKHLKRRASEATQLTPPIPLDTDEVSVECYVVSDGADSGMYIKASVSCDDRPGLLAGLLRTLHGLGLRMVRAELTSLGGRVRHVFMLCREEEGCASGAGLRALKEALWQALAKVASPDMVDGNSSITSSPPLGLQSKRHRIL